jgi:catechol 2,3-dioxygenase-like lactoylglutathione lyase family enzyme
MNLSDTCITDSRDYLSVFPIGLQHCGGDQMGVKGINCLTAHVADLQRSKRFYTETLGWSLETDEHGVAGLSFGQGYLVIHTDNRNADRRPYAGGMHALVDVEDIEAEHKRLQALGVQVSNLTVQPWGQRTFTFSDPDGYVWQYGQPA